MEGVPHGVFQKGARVIDHDGQPATERQYFDRLLEVLIRPRLSERYGDKKQIELSGCIDVRSVTLSLSDLGMLSVQQRTQLAAIMATDLPLIRQLIADLGTTLWFDMTTRAS